MGKTREIKGRIKAVGNIQRITKTMQMIATARFQAAQRRATASQPYTRKIAELVGELAASLPRDGGATHPLLRAPHPPVNRQLVLVITSNRGLCGGFNANVLRTAAAHLREREGTPIDLEVIGRKGVAYFKFNRIPVGQFHSQFTDKPAYEQVEALAQRYMDAFAKGQYDSVTVVYMSFLSMARQVPRVLPLLPMQDPVGGKTEEQKNRKAGNQDAGGKAGDRIGGGGTSPSATTLYDFTPSAKELLDELLPATVKTQLFQCINEAVVGEQIARMVAMKAATDAAGKMRKSLTRKYNRARQTAITTELSEIIGGAAGLA
jgi:F-type H+-transporting ATPase subunit gamma